MKITTVRDIGAAVRDRRRRLGMDQATLAEKAGTTRYWIGDLETGKPTVPMNMVLRVLGKLDLEIDLKVASATDPKHAISASEIEPIDIDAIVNSAKSS